MKKKTEVGAVDEVSKPFFTSICYLIVAQLPLF